MYLELSDRLIEQIEKTFGKDRYDIKGNFIPGDAMIDLVEDLFCENTGLEEKYEDLESDMRDNYKPISKAEQYGV